eukprot:6457821-Amphidinium_carterae.6
MGKQRELGRPVLEPLPQGWTIYGAEVHQGGRLGRTQINVEIERHYGLLYDCGCSLNMAKKGGGRGVNDGDSNVVRKVYVSYRGGGGRVVSME